MPHPAQNPLQGNGAFDDSGTWTAASSPVDIGVRIKGDPAAPVPEPATMLLFGTGLIGLVGSRLRKKRK